MKNKKQKFYFLLSTFFSMLFITSCEAVKEYQKNRINDSEMALSARRAEKNELNFMSYKEGAAGANGGKTGGGCGCN